MFLLARVDLCATEKKSWKPAELSSRLRSWPSSHTYPGGVRFKRPFTAWSTLPGNPRSRSCFIELLAPSVIIISSVMIALEWCACVSLSGVGCRRQQPLLAHARPLCMPAWL